MTNDRRVHIATATGEVIIDLADIRPDGWVEFPEIGLRQYFYWINPETGASIAILEFEKGYGIPNRHTHASNQFMYCLEGRYEYTTDGIILTPGSFYMNPKDNPHGPTIAHEKCRLIEMYDGPHYYEKPAYHTDDTMIVPAVG